MNDRLRVGVIVKPHGLKGEVKVYPTTDDVKRFSKLNQVYLYDDFDKMIESVKIVSSKYKEPFVIVKFDEYDDINKIVNLLKLNIYIDRKDALPLQDGEYYICDLVGCEVYDEDNKKIGNVTNVIKTGANDVYEVDIDIKKIYIPVIPQCIKNVDIKNKKIIVNLLKGILDI